MDTIPKKFQFNSVVDAPLSTDVQSNTVLVEEIGTDIPISIVGGLLIINGTESSGGTVNSGDTLSVRLVSSNLNSDYRSCVITLGDYTTAFLVRTIELSTKFKSVYSQTSLDYNFAASAAQNKLLYINSVSSLQTILDTQEITDDPLTPDYLYVANLYEDSVYKINPINKAVIKVITGLNRPYNVCATYEEDYGSPTGYKDPFLLVSNTGTHSVQLLGASGGSAYLPGTGSGMSFPANAGFAFDTGDFSIELWYFPISETHNRLLTNRVPSASANGTWSLTWGKNVLNFVEVISGENNKIEANYDFILKKWYHIVVTRKNGVASIFINGVRVVTQPYAFNFSSSSQPLYIGGVPGEAYAKGHISDLRIVKGNSVYDPDSETIVVPANLEKVTGTQLLILQNNGVSDASDNQFVCSLITATLSTFSIHNSITFDSMPANITSQGNFYYVTLPYEDKIVCIQRTGFVISKYAETSLPANSKPFAIRSDGTDLWVTLANTNTIARLKIDFSGYKLITVQESPYGIDIDSDLVWVTNSFSNSVSKIDKLTENVETIDCGEYPSFITVNNANVFVVEFETGIIRRIDKQNFDVLESIPTSGFCYGLVADADGNLWVSSYYQNTPSIVANINTKPTDFQTVDLGEGDSNTKLYSEFTISGLGENRHVDYYVPDLLSMTVYVNGVLTTNRGRLKDGDIFKREFTLPSVYALPVEIPTLIAANEAYLEAATFPDLTPDPFIFVPETEVWLRKWFQSNTVIVSGLSEGCTTDLTCESRDTYIVLNDILQGDATIQIQNGDAISLITKTHGPYSSTYFVKLTNTHHFEALWSISTLSLVEPPQSFAYFRLAGNYPAPSVGALHKGIEFQTVFMPSVNKLTVGSGTLLSSSSKIVSGSSAKTILSGKQLFGSVVTDFYADTLVSGSIQATGFANKQVSGNIFAFGLANKQVSGDTDAIGSFHKSISYQVTKTWLPTMPELSTRILPLVSVLKDAMTIPYTYVDGEYHFDIPFSKQMSFSVSANCAKQKICEYGDFGYDIQKLGSPSFGGYGSHVQKLESPDFGGFGADIQKLGSPSFGDFGYDLQRSNFPDFGGFGYNLQKPYLISFGGFGYLYKGTTDVKFGGFGYNLQKLGSPSFGGFGHGIQTPHLISFGSFGYNLQKLCSPEFGGFGSYVHKRSLVSVDKSYRANILNKTSVDMAFIPYYPLSTVNLQSFQHSISTANLITSAPHGLVNTQKMLISLLPEVVLKKSGAFPFLFIDALNRQNNKGSRLPLSVITRFIDTTRVPTTNELWRGIKLASFADLGRIPVKNLYHPSLPYQLVGLHIFHSTFERTLDIPQRFSPHYLDYRSDFIAPMARKGKSLSALDVSPLYGLTVCHTTFFDGHPSPYINSHASLYSAKVGKANSVTSSGFLQKSKSLVNSLKVGYWTKATNAGSGHSTGYRKGIKSEKGFSWDRFDQHATSMYQHVFSGYNLKGTAAYSASRTATYKTNVISHNENRSATYDRIGITSHYIKTVQAPARYSTFAQKYTMIQGRTGVLRTVNMKSVDILLQSWSLNPWYECFKACLDLGMFLTKDLALADGVAHGFALDVLDAYQMPSGCWVWVTIDIPRGERFRFVGGYISGG